MWAKTISLRSEKKSRETGAPYMYSYNVLRLPVPLPNYIPKTHSKLWRFQQIVWYIDHTAVRQRVKKPTNYDVIYSKKETRLWCHSWGRRRSLFLKQLYFWIKSCEAFHLSFSRTGGGGDRERFTRLSKLLSWRWKEEKMWRENKLKYT